MAPSIPGFRLGVYVFKDAEVVDFTAPYGVFAVARRFDPDLEAFLVADALRPVQAQAGFTVLPSYGFAERPAMDAFLIPGGFGTRQEMYNRRLFEFIRSPARGDAADQRLHRVLGLRPDGPARRAAGDQPQGAGPPSRRAAAGWFPSTGSPSLAPACRVSRARVVDAGRIITAGGIASGMEMGFHLLRRAGYDDGFVAEVARVMEYTSAYAALPRRHRGGDPGGSRPGLSGHDAEGQQHAADLGGPGDDLRAAVQAGDEHTPSGPRRLQPPQVEHPTQQRREDLTAASLADRTRATARGSGCRKASVDSSPRLRTTVATVARRRSRGFATRSMALVGAASADR